MNKVMSQMHDSAKDTLHIKVVHTFIIELKSFCHLVITIATIMSQQNILHICSGAGVNEATEIPVYKNHST